jgi:hypothetical protein
MTDESHTALPPPPSLWAVAVVALAVSTGVFALGTWFVLLPKLDAHEQRLADVEELVAEDEPLGDEADEPPPSHAALPSSPAHE